MATAQGLLDLGPIPNLITARAEEELSLKLLSTLRRLRVADGTNGSVCESFLGVPISFDGVSVPLDFLENSGNPVDVIIGCPTLETLQSMLDLGEQHVTVTIRELYIS